MTGTQTLQQRFITFCTEAKAEGVVLSPIEMKAWYAYYKGADPNTLEVQMSVGSTAKRLNLNRQDFINAVDNLTRKGILETLKPGDQATGAIAVRRLVLDVAKMKELQNLPLSKTLSPSEMKMVDLFKENVDAEGKWAVSLKHLANLLHLEEKAVWSVLWYLSKKEIVKTIEKPVDKPAVRQLLRRD